MGNLRWVGIVITGAVTALLMAFAWPFLCYQLRTFIGTNGSSLWLKQFTTIGLVGVAISFVLCAIWYVLGEFLFKESSTGLWWSFFLLTVVAAIIPAVVPGIFTTKVSNIWVAPALYLFNNTVLGYWLSTFLFYPTTQQLVPLLADWYYTKPKK